MFRWLRNHPRPALAMTGAAVAVAVIVLVWFQPQNIFIDTRVDEALPAGLTVSPTTRATAVPPTDTGPPPGGPVTTIPATATSPAPATEAGEPRVLSDTELIDVGRAGNGRAIILELPDGRRILRLEDLDVLNGPDLVVILSPSPLVDDRDAYDDGAFVSLGDLKANQGNQNYEIPHDADLSQFGSIAIWCRRFNYTFNAAPLQLPAGG